MKSPLFQRFDPKDMGGKRFSEDLSLLVSMNQEQWGTIVDALSALVDAPTPIERRTVVKDIEKRTGVPSETVARVWKQVQFFLNAFHDQDLKEGGQVLWAQDLVDSEILRPEDKEKFVSYLSTLKDKALARLEALDRQHSAVVGILPVFQSASTTTEIRGIFKQDYNWGKPVEEYVPELEDMAAIISVALKVDSGLVKLFVFQTTPQGIDYLIAELIAAKKCADVLMKATRTSAESVF